MKKDIIRITLLLTEKQQEILILGLALKSLEAKTYYMKGIITNIELDDRVANIDDMLEQISSSHWIM